MQTPKMLCFFVKRNAVREAKKWRHAVRKAKMGWYAVRKAGGGVTLYIVRWHFDLENTKEKILSVCDEPLHKIKENLTKIDHLLLNMV